MQLFNSLSLYITLSDQKKKPKKLVRENSQRTESSWKLLSAVSPSLPEAKLRGYNSGDRQKASVHLSDPQLRIKGHPEPGCGRQAELAGPSMFVSLSSCGLQVHS